MHPYNCYMYYYGIVVSCIKLLIIEKSKEKQSIFCLNVCTAVAENIIYAAWFLLQQRLPQFAGVDCAMWKSD